MKGERTISEPRFRALAGSAALGIYELDGNGDCVFVNDYWCELTGVDPATAVGRGWESVVHPDDLPGLIAEWRAAAAEKREFALEYRYRRPNGEVVWVDGRAIAMRDSDGPGDGFLVTVVDITERRAIDAERAQSARYFELTHDLRATCGFDGTFKRLNNAWERALGWNVAELLRRPLAELVHPDDLDSVRSQSDRLTAGEPMAELRIRIATAAGGWRWFEWSASPDPEAQLFYAAGRDVTDRVEAEAALERERQQLEDAQQIAKVGSWELLLRDGTEERNWSDQQYRNHGLDPDGSRLTPEDLAETFHADDRERHRELLAALVENPTEFEFDYRVLHGGGEVRTIFAQGRARRQDDGTVRVSGTTRDVTAERDADRLKEEFFGLISHELRTPLTSIIGYAELLGEIEADNLSEQGKGFVEVIDRNSRRELNLVGDLLLLTRISAGNFEIDVGRAEIARIAEETIADARPAADKAGLELSLEVAGGGVIEGDRHRIAQVIENLVSNSIKFTPTGGRVAVRVEENGNGVAVEVSDSGIGIATEDLEHLFDSLYRADEVERRQIQGTGLGLTIVKAIVDAHGATIAVRSEPGEGTSVRVALPATVPRR